MKTDEFDGKKDTIEKIRIYLYGKNLDSIYKKNLFDKNPETRTINSVDYLYIKDDSINAEYLIFDGDISKDKNIATTSLLHDNFLKKNSMILLLLLLTPQKMNLRNYL